MEESCTPMKEGPKRQLSNISKVHQIPKSSEWVKVQAERAESQLTSEERHMQGRSVDARAEVVGDHAVGIIGVVER